MDAYDHFFKSHSERLQKTNWHIASAGPRIDLMTDQGQVTLRSSKRAGCKNALKSSIPSLLSKTEEETGEVWVFLLRTLSQTGRGEEVGREGRNRKAKLFS